MTRAEILARMQAIATEGQALVGKRDKESVEQHRALLDEFDSLEGQLRAQDAVDARNSDDDPQFRGLAERASLGAAVDAILEQRALDGAVAELQSERGLTGNVLPIDLLRTVTPSPADVGASEASVVQPVFSQGDAAYLSFPQPRVPVGDAVYPVLTSRPTVEVKANANSDAVSETTGAFEAEVLKPSRLQASFFWRRTEAARFRGMEAALRMALGSALSEAMDAQVVAQIVADVARTDATAQNTYATYRTALVYSLLDGRYANVENDLRLLVGSATLSHAATKYRTNSSDEDAATALRSLTSGVRVSPHVAAVSASKQDVIVRRGARQDAVAPVWEGVTLVPDAITKADEGEVKLTAIMLAAFKVTRTDGFARVQVQHA